VSAGLKPLDRGRGLVVIWPRLWPHRFPGFGLEIPGRFLTVLSPTVTLLFRLSPISYRPFGFETSGFSASTFSVDFGRVMLIVVGGRVWHDDVRGPVDDVEEHERERKDATGDLINSTSLTLPYIRVNRTGLPPSPHVLKKSTQRSRD